MKNFIACMTSSVSKCLKCIVVAHDYFLTNNETTPNKRGSNNSLLNMPICLYKFFRTISIDVLHKYKTVRY